jgi:hypothetical protein
LATALKPTSAVSVVKVKALVDRAIARGELPNKVDRQLATDFLMGPLYWRLTVPGERCSSAQLRKIAKMTAAALKLRFEWEHQTQEMRISISMSYSHSAKVS